MNILHIITRMDGGGSAVNTLLTATEQARSGHDVSLAMGLSEESAMSVAEREKVEAGIAAFVALGGRVYRLPSLKRELGMHDKQAVRAIRDLDLNRFDIVHTHTSKAGAVGRYAAAKSTAKVVHTPHGHVFHGYFGTVKTRVFLQVEKHLAKKSHALIALTKAERDDHLKLGVGKPGQWHVVPSGVDVRRIQTYVWENPVSEERKAWHTVSVGRLVPVKGMERLIRAWSIVVKTYPDARLALVGDGEEKQHLERLASSLNLISHVVFLGWTDPLPELARARTFALLSYNEGMGRAVVEAMAAGLPCIVSDVCGLKELVDDSVGQVVNADDAQAVANALMRRWPRAVGSAARNRAQAYSIDAMMRGLDEVYARVLE